MDTQQSIGRMFLQACAENRDLPAFSCMGKTLTYSQLESLSAQFAAYLQHHTTLAPGDRIAIQLPNLLQYPVALFGALRCGLVVVNTNPLYTERELEHQLNDSGAKVLITFANLAQAAANVVERTDVKQVIITEVADLHGFFKRHLINGVVKYIKKAIPDCSFPASIRFLDALKLGARDQCSDVERNPSDIAFLQYTGGTTGIAKGAMLSHANLLANMWQIREHWGDVLVPKTDCYIAPLPLYHIYAFTIHCTTLVSLGGHNVLIPNPRDLDSIVKAFKRHTVTGFLGLNTLFVALCRYEAFRNLDFTTLTTTPSGGMPLSNDAANQWQALTGVMPVEGYGMTETSPVVTANQRARHQLGSIGTALPETELKVIDAEGNSLPTDERGELCVRGPQVMQGYWQRPEATADVLDNDGWIQTGDIAVIQEDGFVRIVDRKKDMIIVSGFNVYPNEIEAVLLNHQLIIEAAVIGVPDRNTGEAVKAFLVADENQPLPSEEAIKAYCKENMTGYKVPRFYEFRDELPKSNVGKVLRRELREKVESNNGISTPA